jgi:hypothetical protein
VTQSQLDRAVAAATGEPLRLIRSRGFQLAPRGRDGLEPEDLTLAVACPFCGRQAAYPGPAGDGSIALGECERCDVYFDIVDADVVAAPAA